MLQSSKKVTFKVDILEFENNKLIEVSKFVKVKKNKSKQLNLLEEKIMALSYFHCYAYILLRNLYYRERLKKNNTKKI